MSLELLGTVCLGSEIETCLGVRTMNQGLLRSGARHGETSRCTVLAKSCLPDETFNVVSVRQRGADSLQKDGRNAVSTRITFCSVVLYNLFRVDDALDVQKVEGALVKLVNRDGWRKLGARLRLNVGAF